MGVDCRGVNRYDSAMSRMLKNASVVVTTHNKPEHVCLVLEALARQDVLPSEVLVADDGSSDATRHALAVIVSVLPFRLVHVHQPHAGFRAARSRNNAIYNAQNECIAFLDQDILPHRTWLEQHLRHLRQGRICLGLSIPISEQASVQLTGDFVKAGSFENLHDTAAISQLDSLQKKYLVYSVLRRIRMAIGGRPALRSSNASACRSDLMRVNGFDEDYIGWGQEDDDLGWRLYMGGVRPVPLVNRALVSHIFHPPRHGDWRNGANIERYRRPRTSAQCKTGLSSHPHPDVTVTVL